MDTERLNARLTDLRSARSRFGEAVEQWQRDQLPMTRDSVIKRFEFTFELAWKATRDWLNVWERDIAPSGPRQVLEAGFDRGVVRDANRWSSMLLYRNRTVHVYNELDVDSIAVWVCANGPELFDDLIDNLARDG